MDVVAESGLKWVHFPLKYNTMVWPLCIFDLPHLSWGGGGIHSPGFSLPVSTNINRSAPNFLFTFLLWKHALIKNEEACGKLLTHFSLYLYRIFSSYFFSFLIYLVLIEWKKHPVGHLSLSKHWNLANLLLTSALFRILIIFLAFFNPEFNNYMIQLAIFWLNCDK